MATDKKELNGPGPGLASDLTPAPDSAPGPAPDLTPASSPAVETPKPSPENFSDAANKEDNNARQEKSDAMEEFMEILKEIASQNVLGNKAEDLGNQLWNHFKSPEQTPGEESTAKQDNPIKMDMAADTQNTNLASLNEKGNPALESIPSPTSAAPTPDSVPDLDNIAGAAPKL